MAKTQKAGLLISRSTLSPLAVPFKHSSNSEQDLAQDHYGSNINCFSSLNMEDGEVDYLDYHYDIPVGTQEENCFSHYRLVEFENFDDNHVGVASNSDLLIMNEVSLPMYTQGFENLGSFACFGNNLLYGKKEGMMVDCIGSSFRKESYAGGKASNESLLEGNHVDIHNSCTGSNRNEVPFSVENSSIVLDHNESELDSPCWKGKGIETSGSLFQSFEPGLQQQKEKEKAVRLNPLAPEFLPRSVEGMENSGSDILQDGVSSFLDGSPYPSNFSFGECEPLENSNVRNNCCTGSNSNVALFAVEKSSSILDHDESDLDSPCWKGKGIETSGSLFQSFEPGLSQQKEKEKAVHLNPLAPEFLPRSVEGKEKSSNYFVQDDFSSFLDSSPYHKRFSFGEPLKVADVEPHPFDWKRVRAVLLKDDDDVGQVFPVDNGRRQSSISNSSNLNEPSYIDNFSTLNEDILNAGKVDKSAMENKDVKVEPTRTCKILGSPVKFSIANIRRTPGRQPYSPPADVNMSKIDIIETCMINDKEDHPCHVSLAKDFQIENSKRKVIDEGKSFKDVVKENGEYESKHGSGMETPTPNNNIPDDCIQETSINRALTCLDTTSKIVGGSDSDSLNCRRKETASSPSPSEDSGLRHHELRKCEKSNRLNPSASQFFPVAAGGDSCLGSEHPKDGFSTFQIISTPPPTNVPCDEHGLSKTKMKANSYVTNGIRIEYARDNNDREKETRIQHFREDHVREKTSSVYVDEKRSSLLNSSGATQPSSFSDFSTFIVKPANARCIGDSLQGMEDALQVQQTMASSIATNEVLDCSLSASGSIGDLIEKLLVPSNSISSSFNVDIQNVITAMGVLSELLVKNYSHGTDLHVESQSDMIQHIFNNLLVFWKNHC